MNINSFALIALISTSALAQNAGATQCPAPPGDASVRASYAALTVAEVAALKGDYSAMGDKDEPPFPVDGMSKIDDELSRAVGQVHEDTSVNITVDIDSNGEPSSVSIYGPDGGQVAKYMAGFLMRQKYKAALCNCGPCRQAFWYQRKVTVRPVR